MLKRGIFFIFILFIFMVPFSLSQQISYTSNSETLCSGDTCTLNLYSYEKYWLNENSEWEEVDENWYDCSISLQDVKYCTKNYYFNTTADSQGNIISNLNNQQLSIQLSSFQNTALNQLSLNPTIQGSLLTYEDILPGVDLRYQYLTRKLKEEFIIKQPLQNLNSNFNIGFTKSGNADFVFTDSIICDARGYCEEINHQVNSNNVQLEIPVEFLNNETTVYPVIIDPTLAINDSSINWNGRVYKKSAQYSRLNNPTTINIGEVTPGLITARGDIDWDISNINDRSNILNVTLQIFVESIGGESGTSINITAMNGNSSTYNNDNSGNQNFYNDMGDGDIYSGTVDPEQGIINNFTFNNAGRDNLEESLLVDSFSTGIDPALSASIAISGRDHAIASQRPVLHVIYSIIEDLIYDDNGNLLEGFGKRLTYDAWNRMVEINDSSSNELTARYKYDHDGNRVKKTVFNYDNLGNDLETYYIDASPGGLFIHNRVSNGTIYNETYIYLQDKIIAKIDNNGKKFFYHPDHLGSTTLITDEQGNVVENLTYLPFGGLLDSATTERFLYTGKELDRESEFLYYGARYYNGDFRRFIQPDSIIADVYNPQNLNRYAYVLNNPYKYVDESGNYVVEVGPKVTGTIGIPNILGVGGSVASGIGLSYVPNEGFQIGGFNINAVGVGGGAIGGLELFSINLDRDTSLSDLAGTEKVLGIGVGKGVAGSVETSLDSKSSSVGLGVGAGIGGYIFEQRTLIDIWYDSDDKSASDFIGSELKKDKPRIDEELQRQQNQPVVQQPVNEEGSGRRFKSGASSSSSSGSYSSGSSAGGYSGQSYTPLYGGNCGVNLNCI
jgi:RHS repeat-associated protein